MSKIPDGSVNVSAAFQKRMIELIANEETNDGECNNEEFARRCGVSKNLIASAVNYGIIPSVRSLMKIADYTKKSIEYVLGLSDDPAFEPAVPPSTFQIRLAELMNSTGMENADIANNPITTFSRNSIFLWLKRNNIPSLDFVLQLAKIFDVSPDYLLGRTDYLHN